MTMKAPVARSVFGPVSAHLPRSAMRSVQRAIAEYRRGDPVVLGDENGPVWLAFPAEFMDESRLEELKSLGTGAPRLVLTRQRANALGLVESSDDDAGSDGDALTIAEPGADVIGFSLPEGSELDVIRHFANPVATGRPPRTAGVTEVAGTQADAAAVVLAKRAELLPAALVLPVRSLNGGSDQPADWARRHDLLAVDPAAVLRYELESARTLIRVSEARVPLADCEDTRIIAFRPESGGVEHFAIIIGEPDTSQPVLTRLHSECFTGDLLGSLRCDCGDQLRGAVAQISRQGSGVLLYLAQEGRGIGLVNKLRAYTLQDSGIDTVDANTALGYDPDERTYLVAAEMLRLLDIDQVRLMTNNPAKLEQLGSWGVTVAERVPHIFPSNGHNAFYLRTKAEKTGHMF